MNARGYVYLIFISYVVVNVNSYCRPSDSAGFMRVALHSLTEMEKSNPKKFRDHLQENLQEIRNNYEFGNLPNNETNSYYLFTSQNPDTPYTLTNSYKSLKCSYYDNKYPLVVVIHGYQNELSLQEGTFCELKDALLNHVSPNVLFINFTSINQGAFFVAIKKSFIVARELAKFLKFLKEEGGTPFERMHLIGVSLGAQIAGNTGHKLQGIGRITALDAAGDIFYLFPDDLKLDRNDAILVDAIHTADAFPFPYGLGYFDPIGDLDFYPNGGLHQPGCNQVPTNSSMSFVLKKALRTVCMHAKAEKYYTESIVNNKCHFIGVKCKSYEDFQKGLCSKWNSMTVWMGQPATKPMEALPKNEMFFLNTNAHPPFCKLTGY